MRFFVLASDGNRYGPADVAALNAWIAQDRLTPTMMLEEEGTGRQVLARDVPGLDFPQSSPSSQGASDSGAPYAPRPEQSPYAPNPYQNQSPVHPGYPHGYGQQVGSGSNSDLTTAYVMGVLGLVCCPVIFSVLALVFAGKAEQAGANATGAKVLGYVGLVLGVIGFLVGITGALSTSSF